MEEQVFPTCPRKRCLNSKCIQFPAPHNVRLKGSQLGVVGAGCLVRYEVRPLHLLSACMSPYQCIYDDTELRTDIDIEMHELSIEIVIKRPYDLPHDRKTTSFAA